MRAAWRITLKDLRLRLRDRSALMIGIVVPLVLGFVFNAVFGGAFTGEGSITTIGYVDEDGGEVAGGLGQILEALTAEGVIDVETLDDESELTAQVDDGELPAGIVVPAGTSAAILAGEETEIRVLGGVDSPTSTSIAEGIVSSFATSVADSQRAVEAVLVLTGGAVTPDQIASIAQTSAQAEPVATVGPIEAADRVLEPGTFFSASMAVFFLFFLVQFGVTGLLDEKREGTLTRLEAAPIPRWSIPLGKAFTSLLLGFVSLTVLALAAAVLMGADWGAPLPLAVLFVAVSLAATSLVGIVAAFARTPEGAGNLVAIIAVALGMVGGSFFPVAGGNRAIEIASYATPHSWFLRAVGELSSGGGIVAIAPSLLALLAFAVVGGAISSVFLRRRFG